jgi:hypothetical protein
LTTHVLQLVAGGLSGVLAMSAAIATGVMSVGAGSAGPATLALVGCPGSGSIVAVAKPGDRMLVTAKSADGSWLRVYVPGPAARDGWAPAGSLELLADASSLPVAGCGEVAAAKGAPGPSATSVPATGTTGPTAIPTVMATAKPTTAPTPTATARAQPTTAPTAAAPPTLAPTPTPNVGPVFTSRPKSSVATMFADPSGEGDCWGLPRRTTITVVVTDPDRVTGVQLWVKKPGATSFAQLTHSFSNRTSYWSTFIDAYYDHINAGGTMSFYAIAVDGTGLKTQSKTASIAVRQCDTDAAVTVSIDLPSSDGIYQVPGNCVYGPVPWYFTIRDPDGTVTSALLSLTKTNYLGTGNQTVTLRRLVNPAYWYGESTSFDGETKTSWVMTATDVNGGTTINTGIAVIRSVCIK